MRKLKKFAVTIESSHESFNGYDLKDGKEIFEVFAMNRDSAEKKALKLAYSKGGGYHNEAIKIDE